MDPVHTSKLLHKQPSMSSFTAIMKANCSGVSSTSSDKAILYSPESSIQCIDSYIKDALRNSSSSLYLSFELSSDFEVESVDESSAVDDRETGVRFAASCTTSTIMCLEEYTSEEINACWYDREEIQRMREKNACWASREDIQRLWEKEKREKKSFNILKVLKLTKWKRWWLPQWRAFGLATDCVSRDHCRSQNSSRSPLNQGDTNQSRGFCKQNSDVASRLQHRP